MIWNSVIDTTKGTIWNESARERSRKADKIGNNHQKRKE